MYLTRMMLASHMVVPRLSDVGSCRATIAAAWDYEDNRLLPVRPLRQHLRHQVTREKRLLLHRTRMFSASHQKRIPRTPTPLSFTRLAIREQVPSHSSPYIWTVLRAMEKCCSYISPYACFSAFKVDALSLLYRQCIPRRCCTSD